MLVNPKHPVSRMARTAVGVAVVVGLGVYAIYTIFGPQPARLLEMPGAALTVEQQSENFACVNQVPYLTSLGRPVAAMVTKQGIVDNCESANDTGMGQFGDRYRRYCVNGIQYVKFLTRYSANMFVEFDPVTRRPKTCTGEPDKA
ncbi:hypothetical protein ACRCPS_31215 [Pseudomonas aeruginosa]